MTSFAATESVTVIDDINSVEESEINCFKNRQRRHVLKSKENTYKNKCKKVLKRKLKKYKLRQNGQEDPDILDVSKILVSSLIIKSPNKRNQPILYEGALSEFDDLRPRNYLFKMVRRKESVKISESLKISNKNVNMEDVTIAIPLTPSSQEKKQTNAFKLLMDSRNKSLGSNSPGKDKSNDNSDIEEVAERKNMKAKRHLLLQKMAEAKGSLKNKEREEYQDNIIKKQMEKRAEKLKKMIVKDTKSVKENETTSETASNKDENAKSSPKDKPELVNSKKVNKQAHTLTIVDLFNTVEDPVNITSKVSPIKKFIPKEDQEFLNKLSPSLKKKESMLCYFKKLDKDTECSPPNSENDNVIKVKLQPRNKKRGKKKKLSLKKNSLDSCDLIENDEIDVDEVTSSIIEENKQETLEIMKEEVNIDDVHDTVDVQTASVESIPLNDDAKVEITEVKSERQKRKRKFKVEDKVTVSEDTNEVVNTENRPKRSVKRPVKYSDDACLSSSEDELHIFTPKKKKHIEVGVNDKKPVLLKSKSTDEPVKSKANKKEEKVLKDTVTSKKPAKLAPIFASKQSDQAALEAKQKFLQSGVPDKLKKIIQQQKNSITPDNSFPVVVHVQQSNGISDGSKPVFNIPLMDMTKATCQLNYENDAFKKLLQLNQAISTCNIDATNRKSTQIMLQNMKQLHPKFPVYRTYRLLKGKGKGEFKDCTYVDVDNSIEILSDMVDVISDSPDRLNWTDKYKATSTNQIIGNFETIKELRKWLVSWTENELKSKANSKPGSDSSDYYQSESDSRESMKSMNNLLVLTGPTGCGKTASVYAVASDLAMKVIEVNASSRRTGKIMLQDLQEATQSHKVNRGTGNSDNSQKSQEKLQPDLTTKNKKRGRKPKKSNDDKIKKSSSKTEVLSGATLSQESTRTDSSLILIDDADIVFDQDDGFSSAIVQLVQCSKRPVILITSSLVCPHLQRFLQNGKLLKMSPLLPRMLGTWLDIMCLADSGICWPGVGAKFLNYFKGDIRKTINYLQFCIPSYVHGVTTDEETATQNIDFYKSNIDEESSCPSWAENEDSEGRTITSVNNNVDLETNTIWTDFASKHSNLLNFTCPLQLFNIWWSMPGLLTVTQNIEPLEKVNNKAKQKKKKVILELEAMANAADAFSLSDYFSQINPDTNTYITSQPWCYPEAHSVSERENSEYYRQEYEVTSEICQTMVTGSIETAQDVLGCERKSDLSFPGMTLYRERDRIISRHNSLTGYLNVSGVLDRRALALDYWPSCRTICRLEKSQKDTNMKRNNRFCHYLKSLSVLCKSDTFDNLCDSLCSNEGTELNINNCNE
ncbi:hypothetical protein PYW07_013829 [Mythimna separata]|uniref:ORC1/DEAH AAA+ ATPase domain-containing protein n=1 Tax=Mythimna separata TaxID=271217 RepID=A0AAD7YFV0_MYTSE|nr:hypothetical protein PYW07_013829 [Mythimna separata]